MKKKQKTNLEKRYFNPPPKIFSGVWTLFGNQPPHPPTFGKDIPKKCFFFAASLNHVFFQFWLSPSPSLSAWEFTSARYFLHQYKDFHCKHHHICFVVIITIVIITINLKPLFSTSGSSSPHLRKQQQHPRVRLQQATCNSMPGLPVR